jgi:O-succinylbenzoate synthase
MAVLDAQLRHEGVSMAQHLGGTQPSIDVGVSVGITPTIDELVRQVDGYLADGYGRVKLKIMPRWDVEPLAAVRAAFPDIALQVDANAGYGPDALDLIASLDRFGLLMIEQPFPPEELALHAQLAARMSTPICLDESIVSATHAVMALDRGACTIVNIKVGRVGGVLEARHVHDVWRDVGDRCGSRCQRGARIAAGVRVPGRHLRQRSLLASRPHRAVRAGGFAHRGAHRARARHHGRRGRAGVAGTHAHDRHIPVTSTLYKTLYGVQQWSIRRPGGL